VSTGEEEADVGWEVGGGGEEVEDVGDGV